MVFVAVNARSRINTKKIAHTQIFETEICFAYKEAVDSCKNCIAALEGAAASSLRCYLDGSCRSLIVSVSWWYEAARACRWGLSFASVADRSIDSVRVFWSMRRRVWCGACGRRRRWAYGSTMFGLATNVRLLSTSRDDQRGECNGLASARHVYRLPNGLAAMLRASGQATAAAVAAVAAVAAACLQIEAQTNVCRTGNSRRHPNTRSMRT